MRRAIKRKMPSARKLAGDDVRPLTDWLFKCGLRLLIIEIPSAVSRIPKGTPNINPSRRANWYFFLSNFFDL